MSSSEISYEKQPFQEEYNLNTYKVVMNFDGYGKSIVYVDDKKYLGEFELMDVFDFAHKRYGKNLFLKVFENYFKNKEIKENHFVCKIKKRTKDGKFSVIVGYVLLWRDKNNSEFMPLSISATIQSVGLRKFVMIEFPHKFNAMNMTGRFERAKGYDFIKNNYNGRIQN